MRTITVAIAILAAAAAIAMAEEICGNPCPTGYVWTDKDMGKCIPEAPKTS